MKECKRNYPSHGEGTEHSEGTKTRKKTKRGGYDNGTCSGATQLSQTVGAVSEQENNARRQSKNITRSRDREAGTSACEILPALSALEEAQKI